MQWHEIAINIVLVVVSAITTAIVREIALRVRDKPTKSVNEYAPDKVIVSLGDDGSIGISYMDIADDDTASYFHRWITVDQAEFMIDELEGAVERSNKKVKEDTQ